MIRLIQVCLVVGRKALIQARWINEELNYVVESSLRLNEVVMVKLFW